MAGRQLKGLFQAYRQGDELAFRRAAQEIIDEEEAKQHLALARDLRQLLAAPDAISVGPTVALPEPPTDRDGSWSLAELRHAEKHLEDLVLARTSADRLQGLAREVSAWSRLDAAGVPRRQRILFYGPPGTGKTTAAEGLAAELGWPFLVVRLDAIVSSYLGETASNLRRVVEFAQQGSWVVLFDEFDALGRARDDRDDHGEMHRVVTAFLQLFDRFRGTSLLIAATNHEGLLDPALWRRFDEVVTFPLPTVTQLRQVLKTRLSIGGYRGLDVDGAGSALRGLPQAAAEKVAWDARRSAILDGRERVSGEDLAAAVASATDRPW